jgi:hypothetical protein
MASINIGHRIALDVETKRDGDSLYLFLTVLTDWGEIPIQIGVHADTLKGIATWMRSNYSSMVYDFVTSRKPGR